MQRRQFLQGCAGVATMAAVASGAAGREEHGDPTYEGAKKRIQRHRRGDVTLVVRRPDGRPLERAEVSLTQKGHALRFGCNLFRWGRIPDPRREEAYRERFAALLNYATLPFYWAAYEPVRGHPAYAYTDRVVEWCRREGITCKGHPLAWDHPAGSPAWLPEDPARIAPLSTGRVREIVQRFAGRIDLWDVVNEPTDLTRFRTPMNAWARQLGAVPFTSLHLKEARAANSEATLLVNDYRADEAYLGILQQLLRGPADAAKGSSDLPASSPPPSPGPPQAASAFDVVGIQSHMHGGAWPSRRIWEVCERFAALKRPLHFTETTIVSGPRQGERWGESTAEGEERQAEETTRFYTVLFSHPSVQAITWWDFSDDGAWQGAPAGWLRKDMSPKPVYERLLALVRKEWWTRARGVTGADGEWRARAFFGDYDATVRTPDGRTITQARTVAKGAANRFEIALP